MLDWQVNIVEKNFRKHVIIEDIEEETMMVASLQVIIIEYKAVEHVFEVIISDNYKPGTFYFLIPKQADKVVSILASVDPLFNDQTLYQRMINLADLGKYQMEIGSTIASDPGTYLI